jgi:hypothetical protein
MSVSTIQCWSIVLFISPIHFLSNVKTISPRKKPAQLPSRDTVKILAIMPEMVVMPF